MVNKVAVWRPGEGRNRQGAASSCLTRRRPFEHSAPARGLRGALHHCTSCGACSWETSPWLLQATRSMPATACELLRSLLPSRAGRAIVPLTSSCGCSSQHHTLSRPRSSVSIAQHSGGSSARDGPAYLAAHMQRGVGKGRALLPSYLQSQVAGSLSESGSRRNT